MGIDFGAVFKAKDFGDFVAKSALYPFVFDKKEEKTSPAVLPKAPTVESAGATPETKAKIRRKTKTILSSPLKGGEAYGTPAPTLVGTEEDKKAKVLG